MTVTIYHNPECGTSRNTLAMIRQSGVEPTVVEYLKNPPSRERIVELVAAAGITLRQAIRHKDTPYEALGLGDESITDDALLDAIGQHPILLNRPFVETPIGTRLCRPSGDSLRDHWRNLPGCFCSPRHLAGLPPGLRARPMRFGGR